MLVTVDIPDHELEDAVVFTKAKTRSEAVARAVMQFNRYARMAELTQYGGTCVDLITPEELEIERRKG